MRFALTIRAHKAPFQPAKVVSVTLRCFGEETTFVDNDVDCLQKILEWPKLFEAATEEAERRYNKLNPVPPNDVWEPEQGVGTAFVTTGIELDARQIEELEQATGRPLGPRVSLAASLSRQ